MDPTGKKEGNFWLIICMLAGSYFEVVNSNIGVIYVLHVFSLIGPSVQNYIIACMLEDVIREVLPRTVSILKNDMN